MSQTEAECQLVTNAPGGLDWATSFLHPPHPELLLMRGGPAGQPESYRNPSLGLVSWPRLHVLALC